MPERFSDIWLRTIRAMVPSRTQTDVIPDDDLTRVVNVEPDIIGRPMEYSRLYDRYRGTRREVEILKTGEEVTMQLTIHIGLLNVDSVEAHYSENQPVRSIGVKIVPEENPVDPVLFLPKDERFMHLIERPLQEKLHALIGLFGFRGEQVFTNEPLAELSDEPALYLNGLSPKVVFLGRSKGDLTELIQQRIEDLPSPQRNAFGSGVAREIPQYVSNIVDQNIAGEFVSLDDRRAFINWLELATTATALHLLEVASSSGDVSNEELCEVAFEATIARFLLTNYEATESMSSYVFDFSRNIPGTGFKASAGSNTIDTNVEFGRKYPYEDHVFAIEPLDQDQTGYRIHVSRRGESEEMQIEIPNIGLTHEIYTFLSDERSDDYRKVPQLIPTNVTTVPITST